MFLTEEQLKVQALLVETVTLLCKNGLRFKSDVRIEGLIGITIDSEQVVLVNINEAIMLPSSSENRFRASASGQKSSDYSVGQEGQKLAKARKRKTRVKRNGGNCKDQVVVADDTAADDVAEGSDNACDSVDTASSVKMKRHDMQAEQHLSMTVEDELLGELVSCGTVKLEPGSLGKTCDSIDADDIYEDDGSAGCSKWPSDETGDSGDGTSTIVCPPPAATDQSDTSKSDELALTNVNSYLQTYKCQICNLVVRTSVTLRDHIAGMHGNMPRFVCSCCGKRFKWRSTFFYHRKSCQPMMQQ